MATVVAKVAPTPIIIIISLYITPNTAKSLGLEERNRESKGGEECREGEGFISFPPLWLIFRMS